MIGAFVPKNPEILMQKEKKPHVIEDTLPLGLLVVGYAFLWGALGTVALILADAGHRPLVAILFVLLLVFEGLRPFWNYLQHQSKHPFRIKQDRQS